MADLNEIAESLSRRTIVGDEIEVRLPRETLKASFMDLDEHGELVLELAGGETRLISAGDVYFGE